MGWWKMGREGADLRSHLFLLILYLLATDLDRDGFEIKVRGIKEATTSHAAMTSRG
jgi:hypothetical protein